MTCTMIVTLLILSCLGAATTTSDTLTGENVCSKQVGIWHLGFCNLDIGNCDEYTSKSKIMAAFIKEHKALVLVESRGAFS